jgi:chromosome partitioning protein
MRACDAAPMRTVGVVNYKGGTSKTTSAVYLAHVWAASGAAVLLVDADPQGSSLRWSEQAPAFVPCVGLAVRDLHRRLPGIVGDRYDAVVIDTPPLEQETGVVQSVLRAAHQVVVPMAPTMIEVDRLPPVWRAMDDVEPLRDGPVDATVLLTRVVHNASSTDAVRGMVAASGHKVLTATIPRLERYALAFGDAVPGDDPAYVAAAEELWP